MAMPQSFFNRCYTRWLVWSLCITLLLTHASSCKTVSVNQVEDGVIHIQSLVLHKNVLFDSYTEYDAEIYLQVRMEKSAFISFDNLQWGAEQLPLYFQHEGGFISVANTHTFLAQDSVFILKAICKSYKPSYRLIKSEHTQKVGDEIIREEEERMEEMLPKAVLSYRNKRGKTRKVAVEEIAEVKNFFK
jgi:hypothetical protein